MLNGWRIKDHFAEPPLPVLRVEVSGALTAIPAPMPAASHPWRDIDVLVAAQNRYISYPLIIKRYFKHVSSDYVPFSGVLQRRQAESWIPIAEPVSCHFHSGVLDCISAVWSCGG